MDTPWRIKIFRIQVCEKFYLLSGTVSLRGIFSLGGNGTSGFSEWESWKYRRGIIFQVTVWKNQLQGGREKQFPFLVFATLDYTIPTKPVGYNDIKKYQ